MYKVQKIKQYQVTRDVYLLNLESGTIDICFDDSDLTPFEDFYFITLNSVYDCKIQLSGVYTKYETEVSEKCVILEKDVIIGQRSCFKVLFDNNIYYIVQEKNETYEIINDEYINFIISRKDLIQVNDVIHGDLLKPARY